MPSLQVVDLNSNAPPSDHISKFAQSFGDTLYKNHQKKSDEDIFNRIKKQYPTDKPEELYQHVLETPGMTEDFKKNTLGFLKDFTASKSRSEDQAIRKTTNDINAIKASNQKKALDQTAENQKTQGPSQIAKYNKSIWKDASPEESSLFNRLTGKYISSGLPLDEASNKALEDTKLIQESLDLGMAEKIPDKTWKEFGGILDYTQEREETEQLVVDQTIALLEKGLDESAIKNALKKAKWTDADVKKILEKVRETIEERNQPQQQQPQQSAINGGQQGQVSQAAGVDDILFGG